MSHQGVEAKPHLRFNGGYWRVCAVPVKWSKLSEGSQALFRRAHDAVSKANNRPSRGFSR